MGELDNFRNTTLAQQAKAEQAMVQGDPGPRMELWSRRDPLTLFGASSGMAKTGWDELSRIFHWVASSFSNVSDFRFDVVTAGVSGDFGYSVGYERFNGSWGGRPVSPFEVRVTHAYRREDGDWKIVHRHGDSGVVEQLPPAEASPAASGSGSPSTEASLNQSAASARDQAETDSVETQSSSEAVPGSMEDFSGTILVRQSAAEEAMVMGNPVPRMEQWSRHEPVTLFGTWGMATRGWDELSRTFRWIASRFSEGSDFHFDIEVAHVSRDLGYTVGYERFLASVDGDPVVPMTVRVTHAYRRENGAWRIVHRHADSPPVDQSPPTEETSN